VFYNPKYSLYDKSIEEWTSILELSNAWSFVEVKNLAVRELEKLDIEPIERVFIYHRYNIDRAYLITSYAIICTRPEPLNLQEGRRVGLETALKVAEARERIRAVASEKSGARSPTFADFAPEDVDPIVREVFEIHVRSNPICGGGPSPISGTPSAVNGSHSTSSSAWPPAQVPTTPTGTTPSTTTPRQRQQQQQQQQQATPSPKQQQQHPFSPSFGPSPQGGKPSNSGFGHIWDAVTGFGTGLNSPAGAPGSRGEQQSPVNGAGSQFPTGEPPSISVMLSLVRLLF
jgi:hypothetical protein